MALTTGLPLANIVRAEVITETTSPTTYKFTTASAATLKPFTDKGDEKILRSKNTISAINRTEDIVVGYDIKLKDSTLIPQVLALVDGGSYNEAGSDVVVTGDRVRLKTIPDQYGDNQLDKYPLKTGTLVVKSLDGETTYAVTDDYTINETTGALTRVAEGDIADGETVVCNYTYNPDNDEYVASKAAAAVSRTPVTLNLYTEEKDTSGDTVQYARFTFKHCKGTPVQYDLKDGEFFVPEFELSSRPKNGETPCDITFLSAMPAE